MLKLKSIMCIGTFLKKDHQTKMKDGNVNVVVFKICLFLSLKPDSECQNDYLWLEPTFFGSAEKTQHQIFFKISLLILHDQIKLRLLKFFPFFIN